MILFHSAPSLHCFLHSFIPIICIFSSISTIHYFLGLPLILVTIGFHSKISLAVLLSSIRITRPSQAILLLFMNLTISAFSINSFRIFTFGPVNFDNIWRIRNNMETDKLIEGADIVRFIKAQRIKCLGPIQRMDQARPVRNY